MKERINHPDHYVANGVEVIDFVEAYRLPFHLGAVVKYIARAGRKDSSEYIEDLKKAQWYLDRYVVWMTKEREGEI